MADPRFSLYTASMAYAGPTTVDFQSLDSHRWTPGPQKAPYTPAGAVDKAVQGLASAMPEHEFESCDLLKILGAIDPLVGLNVTGGAVFRRQKRAENDVFVAAATAEHVLYSSSKGWACLKSIAVRQDDERGAMATVGYYPLSTDGLALPETVAEGVLTAVPTPDYNSRYFQGPVAHASQKVDSILGFSVNFGKNFSRTMFDGTTFPKCGSVVGRDPQFKFTTAASNFNAALNQFTNLGTIDLYLMKEDTSTDNQRSVKGNTDHIKISGSTELSADEDSVSQNEDGTVTFTCDVLGTLTVSTTSNIPI